MTEPKRVLVALAAVAIVLVSMPASAQVDLTGNWVTRQHEDWEERTPGSLPVDYLGLPLNEDGRARALEYATARFSLPERQCYIYQPHYVVVGPPGVRIWSETDPVTGHTLAWKIGTPLNNPTITIWMDGRPHPPEGAQHTFAGFTTGEWRGNTLTAYTTHIKEGYLRRNGVRSSDETTFSLHITRHDDTLTLTVVFYDPVYLTEPHILSRSLQLQPAGNFTSQLPSPCIVEAELPSLQGDGDVPHYLPGQNPFVDEMTKLYNIPREAVLGGAETMYPEYRKWLQGKYVAPDKCARYCCGWEGQTGGQIVLSLRCISDGTGRIQPR